MRLCVDCDDLVPPTTSRCTSCAAARQARIDRKRGSSTARGYGQRWRELSKKVVARDRGICHLCGFPGADTTDHIVPKAAGGTDHESNLAAAHRACNSAKRDR